MTTKVFKAKMISTTNPTFAHLAGTTNYSAFNQRVFWFGNLHTSYITEVKKEQTTLTIKTRNSIYTFELLEPVNIDNWKISPEKQKEIEDYLKLN